MISTYRTIINSSTYYFLIFLSLTLGEFWGFLGRHYIYIIVMEEILYSRIKISGVT